jgi:hypothetical protein
MDFTWVTTDDANAIQNSIVDAKGDLISATANDTPARLAVGANGETLVADSSASVGIRYQSNFAAGKNKIINGAFDVWQRGTSISLTSGAEAYGADRFTAVCVFSAGTSSFSRQTFTPGTAPVAGYEGQFFGRVTCGSTSTYANTGQKIEDARTFAGQTVTVSFWAKASASVSYSPALAQNFGSGGSSQVVTYGTAGTLTTSWVRYTATMSVPSISGKTVGTSSFLQFVLEFSNNLNSATIDTWGWQVEASNTATAFQTATGTIQGELSACQRYYIRFGANSGGTTGAYSTYGNGYIVSTTDSSFPVQYPVQMRTAASSVDYANLAIQDFAAGVIAVSAVALNTGFCSTTQSTLSATISGGTAGRGAKILNNNNTSGYLGFSAEL